MSVKEIKRLCELQGTKVSMKVPVRCPQCSNKTLDINVETEKGICSVCGKTATLGDLLAIYEEEELDKHRKFKDISEKNNGVGGNY